MSLAYKIAGIPRTFEEFIDKEKRAGQKQIDVALHVRCTDGHEGAFGLWTLHDTFSELRSGQRNFNLGNIYDLEFLTPYNKQLSLFDGAAELLRETDKTRAQTVQRFLLESIDVAYRLKTMGLEATISGRPLEEARERLRQLQSLS